MNTKLLMTLSAFAMGIAGIVLSFMPHEILNYFDSGNVSAFQAMTLQIAGALYFAFAMVNYTARANLIGGIYARPIAIGNLTHFAIGSLVLIKAASGDWGVGLWALTGTYVVFAAWFGMVFFTHPVKDSNPKANDS